MTDQLCDKCEAFLLDLLDTVTIDTHTGCWLETPRTPFSAISRAYETYVCGKDLSGADRHLANVAVCPWNYTRCSRPEHIRPEYYDTVTRSRDC